MLGLLACATPPAPDRATVGDVVAGGQDVMHVALDLDMDALAATADVDVAVAAGATGIALDARGLDVAEVRLDGARAPFAVREGRLLVPAEPGERLLSVAYTFPARPADAWDGWMPERGFSFLWPYHCGNLYPCDPDPADGVSFALTVNGDAIHADALPTSPPYLPAVAVGSFVETPLGETTGGTSLSVFTSPDGVEDGVAGTAHLVDAFGFVEATYGPYAYGTRAGSVAVDWGAGGYGGMEYHPYWHVAGAHIRSEEVHVHEAVHGWFGNGVRLACWEDLVFAEGTTTYVTARALAEVGGPDLWPTYVAELGLVCENPVANTVALPDTCGEVDILVDPLFSMVPYMKGACFLREVAALVGEDALDRVLASFYDDHLGEAVRMDDLLDALRSVAPDADRAALDSLVEEWLLTEACPERYAQRCGG